MVVSVIKRFPCPMNSLHYITFITLHYIHCVDYFPCYLGCNLPTACIVLVIPFLPLLATATSGQHDSTCSTEDTAGANTLSSTSELGYKVVGDNIDKSVRARYMRSEGHRNKSLHYCMAACTVCLELSLKAKYHDSTRAYIVLVTP